MSDSADDRSGEAARLARQITADIRTRPGAYQDAGRWLDDRFSFHVCLQRLAQKLRIRTHGWQTSWWHGLQRKGRNRTKRRALVLGNRGRLLDALHYFLDSPERIIGKQDAARISMLTSILLDPDADQLRPLPTDFLRDWPWSDKDDFCFREHIQAGEMDCVHTTRKCVWMGMDDKERSAWVGLAKQACEVMRGAGQVEGAGGDGEADPEAKVLEAVEAYVKRMRELAEWLGNELRRCLRPAHRPERARGPGYVGALRSMLAPLAPAAGPVDLDVLASCKVDPRTLLSAFAAGILGPDLHSAVHSLWTLLADLPDELWQASWRPTPDFVEEWLEAVDLLGQCLGVALPAFRRQAGLQAGEATETAVRPGAAAPGVAGREAEPVPEPDGPRPDHADVTRTAASAAPHLGGPDRRDVVEPAWQSTDEIEKQIEVIAPTDASVLLIGETGTGKDYCAEKIHQASERPRKPFVVVNCAAISSTLATSELFGHTKGAHSEARTERAGRVRQAEGGTLFLNELGELPDECQAVLLRFLEDKTIEPAGADEPVVVDVRVLAATNKPESIREDAHYRFKHVLRLPPLRAERDRIPLLAVEFLEEAKKKLGKWRSLRLSEADRRGLAEGYGWPGNVRQLMNAVHSAVEHHQSGRNLTAKEVLDEAKRAEKVGKAPAL